MPPRAESAERQVRAPEGRPVLPEARAGLPPAVPVLDALGAEELHRLARASSALLQGQEPQEQLFSASAQQRDAEEVGAQPVLAGLREAREAREAQVRVSGQGP